MGGGGGLLGGVTDMIGLTDYSGAEASQQAAVEAAKAGADSSVEAAKIYADVASELNKQNIEFNKETLDFMKQQYSDYQSIYGDIQENLGNYYNNLTSDQIANKQLANQAKEYTAVKQQIKSSFAARGLTGSGLEAAAQVAMSMSSAEQRAAIRNNAEDTAITQKLGFLSMGLGQGTAYLGAVGNAASGVSNAYSSAATGALQSGSMISSANLSGSSLLTNVNSSWGANVYNNSTQMTGNIIGLGGALGGGYLAGKTPSGKTPSGKG